MAAPPPGQGLRRNPCRPVSPRSLNALAEIAGEGIERAAARARQRHHGALGVERARDRAADAAGCARDERLAARRSNMALSLA